MSSREFFSNIHSEENVTLGKSSLVNVKADREPIICLFIYIKL